MQEITIPAIVTTITFLTVIIAFLTAIISLINTFIKNPQKDIWTFKIRKNKRISELTDASKYEELDDNSKEFYSREIQKEWFFKRTGIRAEKPFRDELIKIHKNINENENIPFVYFKSASKYFHFVNKKVLIEISKFNIIFNKVIPTIIFASFFLSGTLIFIFSLFTELSTSDKIELYVWGLIYIIMSMFPIPSIHSVRWAKKIKAELEKYYKNIDKEQKESPRKTTLQT